MSPVDPNYVERVRASFARQRAMALLSLSFNQQQATGNQSNCQYEVKQAQRGVD